MTMFGQTPSKPAPDTVIFVNGEQLSGELEKADGAGITFKSAMAGEITVKWSNIKDLKSSKTFAVLLKKQKLTPQNAAAVVPQGMIAANDKTITVADKPVAVADTSMVMPQADFLKIVDAKESILHGWGGAATGGVSLVRATENSTTFNGAINLVRSTPSVPWLPPSSRTSLGYNQSYGRVSQTGAPTLETNIFHADAERDQYFSPRFYAFAGTAFDHNFSQFLALQETFGGGIGMTLFSTPIQKLDVKADVQYERQGFFDPTTNQNLIGSTFSETYVRHLTKTILVNEFGSASPAWNNSNAFSAHINANVVFPVYKGLGFNVSAADDYLNNAPVGSNRNSSQFNLGITYTIKPR